VLSLLVFPRQFPCLIWLRHPFDTFTFIIQWSLADTDVRLFVAGDGNDNFGPILDNVALQEPSKHQTIQ